MFFCHCEALMGECCSCAGECTPLAKAELSSLLFILSMFNIHMLARAWVWVWVKQDRREVCHPCASTGTCMQKKVSQKSAFKLLGSLVALLSQWPKAPKHQLTVSSSPASCLDKCGLSHAIQSFCPNSPQKYFKTWRAASQSFCQWRCWKRG